MSTAKGLEVYPLLLRCYLECADIVCKKKMLKYQQGRYQDIQNQIILAGVGEQSIIQR